MICRVLLLQQMRKVMRPWASRAEEGGCKQRRGQAITTRCGLRRSPMDWIQDHRGESQRMAVGKAAMACVSRHWPWKKSRPGRLAGRSMPRCCCHALHATERARHSRSSVGIPRHSLQLPCETTQSLVESNTQSLPRSRPHTEQEQEEKMREVGKTVVMGRDKVQEELRPKKDLPAKLVDGVVRQ